MDQAVWGLVLGAAGTVIGAAAFVRDWSLRAMLRAAAPTLYVRPHLGLARDFFDAVIGEEGTDRDSAVERFNDSARRLEESLPGINDRQLAAGIRSVLAAWNELLSAAETLPLSAALLDSSNLSGWSEDGDVADDDTTYFDSLPVTVEAARRGRDLSLRALNRIAHLVMKAGLP